MGVEIQVDAAAAAGDVALGEIPRRSSARQSTAMKDASAARFAPSDGDRPLLDDVQRLEELYGSHLFSDVVFVFPSSPVSASCDESPIDSEAEADATAASGATDHHLLPAHRLVLALRSRAFDVALRRSKSSQMPSQVRFPIKIVIEDTPFNVFSTMLRFLYTNEVVVTTDHREKREQFWKNLLRAAFVYIVPSLVQLCVQQLVQLIDQLGESSLSDTKESPVSAELRRLRQILDMLVFCDNVASTNPNSAAHRRASAQTRSSTADLTSRSVERGQRAVAPIDEDLGSQDCMMSLLELETLCMSKLELVPDAQFEALIRREPLDQTDDVEKDLPLVAALKTGNDAITRRLLVDAEAPFFLLTDKIPLFLLAVVSGNLLHCEILIKNDSNVVNLISPLDDGDKEIIAEFGRHQTPLHLASKKGHTSVVELLLSNRAASNLQDDEGNTALHYAANAETAEILLSSSFRTNANIPNRRGQTPLHIAAANGNVGVVNLLIHNGADQDIVDDQGQNAFHVAAANGHTAVALVLLHNNETRQQQAQYERQRQMLPPAAGQELASAQQNGSNTLSDDTSDMDTIPRFDINQEDLKGNTALHLAAMSPSDRCQKMLQLLLENGADPNRSNWFGYTPLHLFCSHHSGPSSVVDGFIEHGANIHVQSLDGSTPLHLAVGRASESVAVALVIAGAHVHLLDAAGRSVVDLAESTNQGVMVVPVLRNLAQAPEWVPDDQVKDCSSCHAVFRVAMRKHHCRHCGRIICYNCSSNKIEIPKFQILKPSRVCDTCYDVLSFRRLL
ncbi:hypothetical protein P43SY_008447 [Pythium insidiosum]|uniref:Myosin-like protein n=1 Tax=Pythium insidiosum TaxID=114742 RepID=A0AAD5LD99_PYTIN|nr:hypothetical protein P43SY_008447 [Pythium insidiosum]